MKGVQARKRAMVDGLVQLHLDRCRASGAEASELMAAVQTAMVGRIPYTALHSAIYSHPTMAEGLTFLLRNTPTPG